MTLRTPRHHDELVNYRIKRLMLLGGAPAVRICEGEFGVPRQEWRLLAALVELGANSPTQLARSVGMEQARASRVTAGLIEKALAERATDAQDRRRATVRATAKGRKLYEALFPRLAEVNTRLLAVLDDEELHIFERCIDKLTQHASCVLHDLPATSAKADRRRGGSRRVWDARKSGI